MTLPTVPARPDVPSWKLIATLGVAGAFAGLILVVVFQLTFPTIQAHKAEVLRQAVQEVLKAPARYDTLYVQDGALIEDLAPDVNPDAFEQVFIGYTESGDVVGFAMAAGEPGFQDVIRLIFGYDPSTNTLLGMKVLESKETPGLGDKIEKDSSFVGQFDGAQPVLEGVKAGAGEQPHEIDMITGATISSRTVIKIINNALARVGPMLQSYGRAP